MVAVFDRATSQSTFQTRGVLCRYPKLAVSPI